MKLTLQLKLLPNAEQAAALLDTMRRFNEAATFVARAGFAAGVFSKASIQRLCYYDLRARFGLSAQMAVRAIAKAAEALASAGTERCPVFRPTGAMTYDQRFLSFKDGHHVSLLTVTLGRVVVPYVFGEYQAASLARIQGQCDLIHCDGQLFLYCTIELQEPPPVAVDDFLGVDLGIVNLATDSDGNRYTGERVETVRRRYARTRRHLQRRGTRSARRILKRLRRREARFRRTENHIISKRLVASAQGTDRGIAVEDLHGIRDRTTVRRRDRAKHSGWAFRQLRAFIEYKAQRAGVPVVAVDPRNSSRTCSACGHCAQGNRRCQERFACRHCGHSEQADLNAARNLRARALRKRASSVAGLASSCKAARR
jgi:IS605 OrfB family transposase